MWTSSGETRSNDGARCSERFGALVMAMEDVAFVRSSVGDEGVRLLRRRMGEGGKTNRQGRSRERLRTHSPLAPGGLLLQEGPSRHVPLHMIQPASPHAKLKHPSPDMDHVQAFAVVGSQRDSRQRTPQ